MITIKPTIKRLVLLKVLLIIGVIIAIGSAAFLYQSQRSLPATIWLPEHSKYTTDDQILYDLPVTSTAVQTRYGRGIRFATEAHWSQDFADSNPWTSIYEFRSRSSLQASKCPNISNIEELSPTDCQRIGSFQNNPVYIINRRLPSGTTEYFVNAGKTFIYISNGGDGGHSMDYLNSFKQVSWLQKTSYLSTNSHQAQQVLAKQKAAKAAVEKASSLAYTHLDFSPALPQKTPAGWTKPEQNMMSLDGPDATHPKLVRLDYLSTKKQTITLFVGKLTDFQLGSQCGPTPFELMKNVDCYKAPGTDFYSAYTTQAEGNFMRYVYYPVGESLIISNAFATQEDAGIPNWLKEITDAQDTITFSAKSADKTALKGSRFIQTFYDASH